MVKPISADDKSNFAACWRNGACADACLVLGAEFFAVVFFNRIRKDVPVYAEAPNLTVELLEQLIGELQNQREFSRRDPARLCKFVANGISDMDGRS